nr:phytoene desaturase [Myxococcales bacterium]
MSQQQRHAVVVGSGFGGLAAAIRLRTSGYAVTLLEAREQLGGRASVIEADGFSFDMGPTVITAPYLIEELFQLAGRDSRDYVEFMPVDPYYRIDFNDGSSFDYVGDQERLLAHIRSFNPADVDNYLRMVKKMEEIFDVGYSQLADVPFDKLSDMLKVVPSLLRLGSYRSVYSMVSRYIKDERLRQVFSFQPLLVGGNPFKVTSIYCLIHWLERKWGVHFARGGTAALVHALARLARDIGVCVRQKSPVKRIEVDVRGRLRGVVLEEGEKVLCDIVVANADPSFVYLNMVDPKHRKTHTDR